MKVLFHSVIHLYFHFQNITASFNKQTGMTADEAKVAFLKAVHRWPTFGCAFFDVKVRPPASAAHTMVILVSAIKLAAWAACLSDRY